MHYTTPRTACPATRERLLHVAPSSSKAGAQHPSSVEASAAPFLRFLLLVPSRLLFNIGAVAYPPKFLKPLSILWQTG